MDGGGECFEVLLDDGVKVAERRTEIYSYPDGLTLPAVPVEDIECECRANYGEYHFVGCHSSRCPRCGKTFGFCRCYELTRINADVKDMIDEINDIASGFVTDAILWNGETESDKGLEIYIRSLWAAAREINDIRSAALRTFSLWNSEIVADYIGRLACGKTVGVPVSFRHAFEWYMTAVDKFESVLGGLFDVEE